MALIITRYFFFNLLKYIPLYEKLLTYLKECCKIMWVMNMLIDFNKDRLEKSLFDFCAATGININVTDENFNMFTVSYNGHNKYCACIQSQQSGLEKCLSSDMELLAKCKETKQAQYHVCHAGLIDVAVPIIHADTVIGYLILGQMKKTEDFTHYLENNSSLPFDVDTMKKHYDNLVLFDEKRIKSVINIALMLAKHILLEKMLYPVTNACVERTVYYISRNLSQPMSIKKLSSSVGYSASEIYKSFHKYLHCTVGDFITKSRLEYAEGLLVETDMSIEEISSECGFSNATYFSKKFKEYNGISPLKFRKQASSK